MKPQKILEALVDCLTGPIHVCERPVSAISTPLDISRKHQAQIATERLVRLMKTLHREPPASLDEIRAAPKGLAIPEISWHHVRPQRRTGTQSVDDGRVRLRVRRRHRPGNVCRPLRRGVGGAIPVGDVEMFYQEFGERGGWGWLDADERRGIGEFIQNVREREHAPENRRSS
jgi:hypothetical protein